MQEQLYFLSKENSSTVKAFHIGSNLPYLHITYLACVSNGQQCKYAGYLKMNVDFLPDHYQHHFHVR